MKYPFYFKYFIQYFKLCKANFTDDRIPLTIGEARREIMKMVIEKPLIKEIAFVIIIK